jgi:hypothetical protein
VLADAGVENVNGAVDKLIESVNGAVDKLIESGLLRRLPAQTELRFSNSMIKAWWRVLKHQWLFLNSLDSITTLRRLVSFYLEEHNSRLPHSAFRGQTPDEMYYGSGDHVPRELEQARLTARRARLEANRQMDCVICPKITQEMSLGNSEAA